MPFCDCEYGKDEVNDIDDILLIKCKKCIEEDEQALLEQQWEQSEEWNKLTDQEKEIIREEEQRVRGLEELEKKEQQQKDLKKVKKVKKNCFICRTELQRDIDGVLLCISEYFWNNRRDFCKKCYEDKQLMVETQNNILRGKGRGKED